MQSRVGFVHYKMQKKQHKFTVQFFLDRLFDDICLQICILYQSAPSANKNCTICSPHETFAFCRQLSLPTNFIHTHPASCIPFEFAKNLFPLSWPQLSQQIEKVKDIQNPVFRFEHLQNAAEDSFPLGWVPSVCFASMVCQGNDGGWSNSSTWWTTSPPKPYGCFTCACVCKLWVWEGNLRSCHFYFFWNFVSSSHLEGIL